ncbi:MAG: FHA domain-containing protein [Lachnospiraceae bacterium]|nr:FHA domain-containing protein [Lachnospiraceae bacterium]
MNEEYIYSFNRNYIKWKISVKEGQKVRYQYQIVTTRKLAGLLAVDMYVTDGEHALYYDISSMQNLEKWFTKEKINKKWIGRIAEGIRTALYSLEEYLLDGRNLLTKPEHIFVNMESEKIYFVYFPYYIEEKQQDMEKFLTFLVENADEEDADTIEAVYDIYAKWESRKEQFTWETFLALWEKHVECMEEKEVLEISREEAEEVTLPEETKQEKSKESLGKRDIADFFFGRHKFMNRKAYQENVAAEDWEYKGEAVKQKTESEKTAAIKSALKEEVSDKIVSKVVENPIDDTEPEERKLYGNGKQNRRVLRLEKLPAVIGKKEEVADIVLQDASIGIMHARFTEENGQVYLEDLNTEQGTYKNSVRLKPYERVEILREDEIRLGKLEFTYR